MTTDEATAAGTAARTGAAGTDATWADPGAWIAEAYETYAWELEAYVGRRFGRHLVPEDVVHEAFARLVHEASAGRMPILVRPWLYRVAHNLAVSELRRPAWLEPGEDGEIAPGPTARSAEAECEAWSLSPEIRQALDALSGAGRTSILMAAHGYTGREIASAVGRSEVAARTLLCRTRRTLRGVLAGAGHVLEQGGAPQLAA